jgi:hypothetical protein
MEGNMAIYVIGAMRRAKLMIGGRILALAIQFTLAQDAAGQQATSQRLPLLYRQSEISAVVSSSSISSVLTMTPSPTETGGSSVRQ